MWVVLIFAVVHIYFVFLSSVIEHDRNIRFDLFRLQVHAQAKSSPLVSNDTVQEFANKQIGVLVLGLGNVLLGDDGLGAAAVALHRARLYCPARRPT